MTAPTPPSPALADAVARIRWEDAGPVRDPVAAMADEVRTGLSSDVPWLPSKYFYDAKGAALFDAITELAEYDLLRNEDAILAAHAASITDGVRPREILELGSGSGRKTERLVDAALETGRLETLSFLDVNRDGLTDALGRFGVEHPGLALRALVGDFTRDLGRVPRRDDLLVLFLGSTIGNLDPRTEAPALFRDVARVLGGGSAFLCGFDLEKDRRELELAYDDPRGITAEFNRNILRVVNARLGADFDPDAFDHVALYDPGRSWIEMRLRARRAVHVTIPKAGFEFRCAAGDEIRTEISAKWTRASVERALAGTGLSMSRWLTDARGRFADALLVPSGRSPGGSG